MRGAIVISVTRLGLSLNPIFRSRLLDVGQGAAVGGLVRLPRRVRALPLPPRHPLLRPLLHGVPAPEQEKPEHGRHLPAGARVRKPRQAVQVSAANRLIGEVVQSRRRPLLGPSPG